MEKTIENIKKILHIGAGSKVEKKNGRIRQQKEIKLVKLCNCKHFFPGTLYPPSIQSETKEQLTRTVAKNDGRNVNNSSPSFA